MSPPRCPSLEELDRFQAGQLSDPEVESVAGHVEGCQACQRALETAIGDSADTVLSALLADAEPAPFAQERACYLAIERLAAIGEHTTSRSDVTEQTVDVVARSASGAIDRRAEGVSPPVPPPNEAALLPVESIREYKLLAKLGEGGMGAVYKALHTRLDKVVAIKVLPAERMRDSSAVARFQREMKAVGKVDHPNIVRAMDAGEADGMHFLVMEYVEGIDLSQLAKTLGPLPIADACELVRQAAQGLAEAHEHGMVHRDIKPSNLILAQPRKKKAAPTVKILDLGLALLSEALSPENQGLTSTGQMMGTIDYMAPEQGGDSHQVDIRADIYSLGATLYRLLSGSAPFAGEKYDTPVKKLMALALHDPPPVASLRPDVPAELAAVLQKMMAKDPAARFATPEDLAEALAPHCQGANLSALLARSQGTHPLPLGEGRGEGIPPVDAGTLDQITTPSAATLPAPAAANGTHIRAKSTSPTRRLPRWPLIAAGLGGLGALALISFGIMFFIQTAHGTVQVEINDPHITVVVDGDGRAVFEGGPIGSKHKIKVKPGPHGLTITRGDLKFDTDKFELEKGETTRLLVRYLPGKVQVVRAEDGKLLGEGMPKTFALVFDGKDDYVELPSLKFDGATPYTMEIWAEIDEPARTTPQLLHFSGLPGRRAKLAITPHSGGPMLVHDVYAGEVDPQAGTVPYQHLRYDQAIAGGRMHVAACWSKESGPTLYLNGKKVPTPARTWSLGWPPGRPSVIGATPGVGANDQLSGKVWSVRFSKTVRYHKDFTPEAGWQPDAETLALYRFDEGQGDVLKDSSGNGHHGKIVGAKWVLTRGEPFGQSDYALDFTSDVVPIYVVGPEVNLADPITVEAFVNLRKLDQPCEIACWQAPREKGNWLYLQGRRDESGQGKWLATFSDNLGEGSVWGAPIAFGQRMHVAAVRKGNTATIFVNGKRHSSWDGIDRVEGKVASSFLLGGHLDGAIDEVRFSKVVRYDQDFEPIDRFEPDEHTVALYHFDDRRGDVLTDSSGNGHHGKIVGAKRVRSDLSSPAAAPEGRWALDLSGWASDQFSAGVEVPLRMKATEPFTVELYATPRSVSGIKSMLWHLEGNWLLQLNASIPANGGMISLLAGPGEGKYDGVFKQNHAQPGKQLRLAATSDGKVMSLYVDGQFVNSKPITRPLPDGPLVCHFGNTLRGNGTTPFDGTFEAARISRTVRYDKNFTPPAQLTADADTLLLYRFDEGQGDVVRDWSGNHHHGKILGGKWVRARDAVGRSTSTGKIESLSHEGHALSFESEVPPMVIPDVSIDPRGEYTVEGYVRPRRKETTKEGAATIFGLHQGPDVPDGTNIWFTIGVLFPNNLLCARYSHGDGLNSAPGPDDLPDRLVHIAAVRTPERVTLFVDGKLLQTSSKPKDSGPDPIPGKLVLGLNYAGTLDEVRISKVARYAADFKPELRFESDTDTLALYHFDEGAGEELKDSSGNGHHGKIVGAKWVRLDASTSAPLAPGQTIDLLKLWDLKQGVVNGTWTRAGGGIASDGGAPFSRIKLPFTPPREYDFRIEFTARGGNDILQIFPVGEKNCTWLMGAWGGKFDGFDTVKDHPLTREGTNIIGGPTSIRPGQRHTSVVQVRRDYIAASIDGKEVVRHVTDGSDLGVPSEWSLGDGAIGLGTTFDAVTFHKVELVAPPPSPAQQSSPVSIPEPPPLAEWLKGRTILTVAQDGSGQYKTIQAALDVVKPGQVVKVLDRGPYYERLKVSNPPRDCGLISDVKTVVELRELSSGGRKSPDGVDIYDGHGWSDVDGFRLNGLHFVFPEAAEVPKSSAGFAAGGLTIVRPGGFVMENCRLEGRAKSPNWDSITLAFQPDGSPAPACIRDCYISGGVRFNSSDTEAALLLTRNYLLKISKNYRPNLKVFGTVYEKVIIRHNIFDGLPEGTDIEAGQFIEEIKVLEISNNTLNSRVPINVVARAPKGSIVVQNNLCTKPGVIAFQVPVQEQVDAAFAAWHVGHNCYPRPFDAGEVPLAFPKGRGDVAARVAFLSHDAKQADYFRLPLDSLVSTSGAGGQWPVYIGALPPGPAPKEGDWFTRLRERWGDP